MLKAFIILIAAFALTTCSPPEPDQQDPTVALIQLIEKAWGGDAEAIQGVLACLDNTPSYKRKEWAEYYWFLALERAGVKVEEEQVDLAKAAIKPEDLWLVEEWHLDPESYPPFTSLKYLQC